MHRIFVISSNYTSEKKDNIFIVGLDYKLPLGKHELVSFSCTNQLYNIKKNINDHVYFSYQDSSKSHEGIILRIEEGNYNISDLIAKLNKMFYLYFKHEDIDEIIQVKYSITTGKFKFICSRGKIRFDFDEKNLFGANKILGLSQINQKDYKKIISSDSTMDLHHLNSYISIKILESSSYDIILANGTESNLLIHMLNKFQDKFVYNKIESHNQTIKLKNGTEKLHIAFFNQDGIPLTNLDQWVIVLRKYD